MYIAGLGLPFAEPQALNGLACASLAGSFYLSFPGSGHWKNTEKKAGKAVHMPKGSRGLYISIAHGLVLLGPSLLFLFTIPPNKFAQPDWLTKYALPEATPRVYYVVRMGSCASLWWAGLIMTRCFKHLDAQWNYIGIEQLCDASDGKYDCTYRDVLNIPPARVSNIAPYGRGRSGIGYLPPHWAC
ncbi:hypothetical protein AG1IA_03873 [Rhizoctonia solani AG-1 IA]|uniref:Uncharacterized protein n=1 Tax=Thanatephorus cucumeris (strain AG1-IA) TaxID=983506 RepID=L8WVS5_THACA|nr:hypothetical protein AG1IA_03873 [Rhizoctonia solani AG-1 IA]